ncbi:MAG: VWA domain-containing protein [Nitrospiria bacterium]
MDSRLEEFSGKIHQISPKAARAFDRISVELSQELPFHLFQTWFNLGFLISYASSANGIKFFNDSPEILRQIKHHPALQASLQTGLHLGLEPNSMAVDYFRRLPDLISRFSPETLDEWARKGNLLAREDYLTGTEYFKSGPSILPILDPALLEPWGKIGLLLSREDIQAKSFLTLEFFRTSPEIFARVKDSSLHPQILKIGHALALQAPKETLGYLKAVPAIFQNLHQEEGVHLIFSLAGEIGFQAPAAVIDFLTHATDLLKMMNGNLTSLKVFVEAGLKIKENPELVRAFFALKSQKSIETIRSLSHNVFLSDVHKRLKYYAEMITGRAVEITPGLIPSSRLKDQTGTIILPEKINVYMDRENNLKLYKLMTLHESAHIEFGSYTPLGPASIRELMALSEKEGLTFSTRQPVWRYFPDPVLAQNLWMIAEESRIDYLLRLKYSGAMRELKPVLASQKGKRPDLFQLPEEKAVLEALFQLSVNEDIVVPLPIANTVSRAFSILKTLWHPETTVEDTLHSVCLIYDQFRKEIKQNTPEDKKPDVIPPGENIPNYGTIPESAFSNHGLITPDLAFQTESAPVDSSFNLNMTGNQPPQQVQSETITLSPRPAGEQASNKMSVKPGAKDYFSYPEWDWMSQDYKPGWCKLIEKGFEPPPIHPTGPDLSYGPILSLRRYFEKLRPENYRNIKNERDGDEFDFDRLIEAMADMRAGITPSENFYVRREKKERKISVAFLIDLSGSTRQIIPGSGKRIIDIEIESLMLMAEALNTIGDEYGIFGFSGQSREQIEFYTIKGFDEKDALLFNQKLGALEPLKQNRDGTAIRHLTRKLVQRETKTKLMIILSDGKPLDDDYQELYALEDTKMALREAKNRGIHPFCITVDQQASDYIQKMYQDVNYMFISDIQTLPRKLPQIYKKLTT